MWCILNYIPWTILFSSILLFIRRLILFFRIWRIMLNLKWLYILYLSFLLIVIVYNFISITFFICLWFINLRWMRQLFKIVLSVFELFFIQLRLTFYPFLDIWSKIISLCLFIHLLNCLLESHIFCCICLFKKYFTLNFTF